MCFLFIVFLLLYFDCGFDFWFHVNLQWDRKDVNGIITVLKEYFCVTLLEYFYLVYSCALLSCRMEKEVESLEREELNISRKEEIVLQRLKAVEKSNQEIIQVTKPPLQETPGTPEEGKTSQHMIKQ